MAEEWVEQMKNQVNTLEKLEKYINVSDDVTLGSSRRRLNAGRGQWGTYFRL